MSGLTKVIRRLLRRTIHGDCDMYVDDIIGACSVFKLGHDLLAGRTLCESLLGPDSVEHRKTEHGRHVDLDLSSVSISQRNFMKTLSGFLSASQTPSVPVRELERLASWASRYSMIYRSLRPFTHQLYAAQRVVSRNGSVIKSQSLTDTSY